MRDLQKNLKLRETAPSLIYGMQAILLLLFTFPIFFQLSGQVFHEVTYPFDPKGDVFKTPLPLAIPFCFIAIVLLYRFENRQFGIGFLFGFLLCLLLSLTLVSNGDGKAFFSRFILLIQFLLPLFAFTLGHLYLQPKHTTFRFEALALYMLLIVVTLQLTNTFLSGSGALLPDVIFFSLYQHIQYLPVIFIALFFIAAASLFHQSIFRWIILFFSPFIGVYCSAALSISCLILMVTGSLIFLVTTQRHFFFRLLTVLLIWTASAWHMNMVSPYFAHKLGPNLTSDFELPFIRKAVPQGEVSDQLSGTIKLPKFIDERRIIWSYYLDKIVSGPKTLLFGNLHRPERASVPSAHNYYLDLIYNFGLVSVIPIFYLLVFTFLQSLKLLRRGLFPRELWMLGFVVAYFVLIENIFKVAFRQPYPGMIMFFLWGVFVERLRNTKNAQG